MQEELLHLQELGEVRGQRGIALVTKKQHKERLHEEAAAAQAADREAAKAARRAAALRESVFNRTAMVSCYMT